MAYRYMQIGSPAEAYDNEQICAVYDNPLHNTTGTKNADNIIRAFDDAHENKCRLVVWRDDDNKHYYQYIDSNGRLRENNTPVHTKAGPADLSDRLRGGILQLQGLEIRIKGTDGRIIPITEVSADADNILTLTI